MPGYVSDHTRAIDRLQVEAAGADYNVRVWLSDWVLDVKNTPGNETLTQRQVFDKAVQRTSVEIQAANAEQEQRIIQSQSRSRGPRMRP